MKNLITLLLFLISTPTFSQDANLKSTNSRENTRNLPYPIIFVHGLTGSHTTWGEWKKFWTDKNFKFGGRLSYHLEFDKKFTHCNYGDDLRYFDRGTLSDGDFYILNFNTDLEGNDLGEGFFAAMNPTNSNQASIAKQGLIVSHAIVQVLTTSQADKVILVGHSMGGLAIREYLQNPDLWVGGNTHHVAKYVSLGTPHSGSNLTGVGVGNLIGLDEESDAVRDLRSSYFSAAELGVFLFGGIESRETIKNGLFSNYHSIDVNCNNSIGDNITGLNRKPTSSDLEYACVIGGILGNDLSDGVVSRASADLSNLGAFSNKQLEIFTASGLFNSNTNHLALPENIEFILRGIDEPDNYEHSYKIDLEKRYAGYITQQGTGTFGLDYDDYLFEFDGDGSFQIETDNAHHTNFKVSILDKAGTGKFYEYFLPKNQFYRSPKISLGPGEYILELEAKPVETEEKFPYTFKVIQTRDPIVSTEELTTTDRIEIYPNPTTGRIQIMHGIDIHTYKLHNLIGQELANGVILQDELDFSVDGGIYLLHFYDEDGGLMGIERLVIR